MINSAKFAATFPGVVCVSNTPHVVRWSNRDGSPITVAQLKAIEQFFAVKEELPAGSLSGVRGGAAKVVYSGALSRFAALEGGAQTVTRTVSPKKHLPPASRSSSAAAKPSRSVNERMAMAMQQMEVEARPLSMDALANRFARLHPRVEELRRESL